MTGSQRKPGADHARLNVVVLGLSLSSSWGNGHATTYRALLRAFAAARPRRDRSWSATSPGMPATATSPIPPGAASPSTSRSANSNAGATSSRTPTPSSSGPMSPTASPWGGSCSGLPAESRRSTTSTRRSRSPRSERGDCAYLTPDLIPGYDLYLSFTGGPTLDRLELDFGSPAARALYCSVDTDLYRPLDCAKQWDLSYLGTYSPDRQPVLERLLLEPARRAPHLKFVVAGPQYPAEIDWPANVQRLDHVGPSQHPAFYAASRWTLNVTRADMVRAGFSPSVRLFEAAACATPIISDNWPGLDTLFEPGSDIALAASASDVLDLLHRPEAAPPAPGPRRAIADRGRAFRASPRSRTGGRHS